MCGIAGIYSLDNQPLRRSDLEAQIETMIHRGPNQGGVYLSPGRICGLGIRRLSIIDVAGGHQPLSNETDQIQLVYNGETYNHRSLRQELEAIGHRPKSNSDGEVVLHGYEAWGPAATMQKLRGMVAFALWDDEHHRLFVGRDRFGIKPLYYAEHAGRLYFASEIKAILSQPDFPRRVNVSALEAMLTLGFVPGPATMFERVYKLPPAHYLLAEDGKFHIHRYWQLDYVEDRRISAAAAAEQLLALLQEAVRIRLMSEVPLGTLLSGGIDSGTVVSLTQAALTEIAAQQSTMAVNIAGPRLKTISIGFEQPGYDEAALAEALAGVIGTEHHAIRFTSRDFEDYPAIMGHLEEPQGAATAVPIYRLYQACHEAGLTVVLTGEGADELFGGYHWHKGDALMRPLLRLPQPIRQALAASSLPMSTAARRVLSQGAKTTSSRYQDWLTITTPDQRHHLFTPDLRSELSRNGSNPLLTGWAEKLGQAATAAPLHQTLWLETQTRLVDFINFEVDKMSMAHSIEARVPFLDHKLWEFCATLPAAYKLRGRTEKFLLRQAMRGRLPEATRSRRKVGLASPYAAWLRAERLPDWAETLLTPDAVHQTGLFDPAAVQSLRQGHQAGQPDLGPLLMGVLSTQLWFDLFIR